MRCRPPPPAAAASGSSRVRESVPFRPPSLVVLVTMLSPTTPSGAYLEIGDQLPGRGYAAHSWEPLVQTQVFEDGAGVRMPDAGRGAQHAHACPKFSVSACRRRSLALNRSSSSATHR